MSGKEKIEERKPEMVVEAHENSTEKNMPSSAGNTVASNEQDLLSAEKENASKVPATESALDRFINVEINMLKGIFTFAFIKLPLGIFNFLKFALKWLLTKENWKLLQKWFKLIGLGILILVIIFLGWYVLMRERAVEIIKGFIAFIGGFFSSIAHFIHAYGAYIWMVIAITGCFWGWKHYSNKYDAERRGEEYHSPLSQYFKRWRENRQKKNNETTGTEQTGSAK